MKVLYTVLKLQTQINHKDKYINTKTINETAKPTDLNQPQRQIYQQQQQQQQQHQQQQQQQQQNSTT